MKQKETVFAAGNPTSALKFIEYCALSSSNTGKYRHCSEIMPGTITYKVSFIAMTTKLIIIDWTIAFCYMSAHALKSVLGVMCCVA